MLLDSLNALILAAEDALHTSCGLSVTGHGVSLLRQGSLTFPALAELQIRNGPLQQVHLGCDAGLCTHIAGMAAGDDETNGIEALAARYLEQLLSEMNARNPRGAIHSLDVGPMTLVSRGRRSFGLRMETEAGHFFVLAEIPSKMELELAKGSEYMPAMESSYLPPGWENRKAMDGNLAVENLLVFLRKVEADVVFEVPGEDGLSFVHTGVLLENSNREGERGLKFCTDLTAAGRPLVEPGTELRATVGIGDRSLQFTMVLQGTDVHPLVGGAELPCAYFRPPEEVSISQRRLAFRIPVREPVPVRLLAGIEESSPWGDGTDEEPVLFEGHLGDVSFSGARLVADDSNGPVALEINRRVVCQVSFPDQDEPVSVLAAVRRSTSRLIDRNTRQYEVGLEFLISQDADRAALDAIREFVLAEQRAQLAQRISVGQ